jgi:hypothetical protein
MDGRMQYKRGFQIAAQPTTGPDRLPPIHSRCMWMQFRVRARCPRRGSLSSASATRPAANTGPQGGCHACGTGRPARPTLQHERVFEDHGRQAGREPRQRLSRDEGVVVYVQVGLQVPHGTTISTYRCTTGSASGSTCRCTSSTTTYDGTLSSTAGGSTTGGGSAGGGTSRCGASSTMPCGARRGGEGAGRVSRIEALLRTRQQRLVVVAHQQAVLVACGGRQREEAKGGGTWKNVGNVRKKRERGGKGGRHIEKRQECRKRRGEGVSSGRRAAGLSGRCISANQNGGKGGTEQRRQRPEAPPPVTRASPAHSLTNTMRGGWCYTQHPLEACALQNSAAASECLTRERPRLCPLVDIHDAGDELHSISGGSAARSQREGGGMRKGEGAIRIAC